MRIYETLTGINVTAAIEEPAAASAQSMTGPVEDALDQLNEPAGAPSVSATGAFGDENESKGEAASQHNDAPAATKASSDER